MPYYPKLIIGVEHTQSEIQNVNKILADSQLLSGSIVGTESYAYPICLADRYLEKDWSIFFNKVGDFVAKHGGSYQPLVYREDYQYICHELDREKYVIPKVNEYKFWQSRYWSNPKDITEIVIKQFGQLASKKYTRSSDYEEFMYYMKPMIEARVSRKYSKLENLIYGGDIIRDDRMITESLRHKPDIVIIGIAHVPTFMIEFPKATFQIV